MILLLATSLIIVINMLQNKNVQKSIKNITKSSFIQDGGTWVVHNKVFNDMETLNK